MAGVYNRGKFIIANSSLDWASDTIRTLLVDSSYTFDPDSNFVADVSSDEVSDGSYARVTLSNKGVTEDDTNDLASLDADPADYGVLTGVTPSGIVVFKFVTNDADSPLISFSDAGFGATANGAGYVVNWEGGSDNQVVILEDCAP
jgi:hypothetical protein